MGEGLVFPPHALQPHAFAPQIRRRDIAPSEPLAPAKDEIEARRIQLDVANDAGTVTGDARCRITIGAVMIFGSILILAVSA